MKNNYIDTSFNNLVDYIKERSMEDIILAIKQNFYYSQSINFSKYKSITDYYNKYQLWGKVNLEDNELELIERNAESLVNHLDDFKWLYNQLGDYRSKMILVNVLYYWLMLDDRRISKLKDDFYAQYFDLDLIKCDQNEVFVDVGAYTGDTVISYISVFGKDNYKKIYCYEIIPANIELIKNNINNYNLSNVIIREKGATDINGKSFIESDEISSIKKLTDQGQFEMETVKIDDDIKGKVTFVKMDIEGGELEAIFGLKEKITKYKPKLAISVYHNNEHLWKIPKIIHEMNPKYKLYLRYYGGGLLPTEYILYAI